MTKRQAIPLAILALVLAIAAGCAASDQSQRGNDPYATQNRDRNSGMGPGGNGGGY